MPKLYVFDVVRYVKVCEGAKVTQFEGKYQIPAETEQKAMFKLGCIYYGYELADSHEEAINMCEREENFKAITVGFASVHHM